MTSVIWAYFFSLKVTLTFSMPLLANKTFLFNTTCVVQHLDIPIQELVHYRLKLTMYVTNKHLNWLSSNKIRTDSQIRYLNSISGWDFFEN